jgi:hypothetical protein
VYYDDVHLAVACVVFENEAIDQVTVTEAVRMVRAKTKEATNRRKKWESLGLHWSVLLATRFSLFRANSAAQVRSSIAKERKASTNHDTASAQHFTNIPNTFFSFFVFPEISSSTLAYACARTRQKWLAQC